MDEMLELFAGGCQADYLLNELTYKEAISLRNARIKRKQKEIEEDLEREKKEREIQQRMAARGKILN